jgi:hypothetical protein
MHMHPLDSHRIDLRSYIFSIHQNSLAQCTDRCFHHCMRITSLGCTASCLFSVLQCIREPAPSTLHREQPSEDAESDVTRIDICRRRRDRCVVKVRIRRAVQDPDPVGHLDRFQLSDLAQNMSSSGSCSHPRLATFSKPVSAMFHRASAGSPAKIAGMGRGQVCRRLCVRSPYVPAS